MRARKALGWLLVLLAASGARAAEPDPFATCARAVESSPAELEAWRCYWKLSRRLSLPREALAALGREIEARDGDPRGELYRATILADLDDPLALASYEQASAGCARLEDWTCVVYTRLSLAFLHRYEPELAGPELDRALAAAQRAGDPILAARVRIGEGWRAVFDEEFGPARSAFLAALEGLGESAPFDARDAALSGLGYVAWATGQLDEALRLYREEAELARAAPDPFIEASAQFNIVFVETLRLREQDAGAQLPLAELEEALATAVRAQHRGTEAKVRLLLAQSGVAPERRREELKAARDAARAAGATEELAAVFRLEAGELAREGRPEAAMARLEQGIRLAREGRVREEILRGELFAPILLWQAGDPRAAFARARRAVAGVERLLTLQPLARDRAGLELHWLDAAYALARLLVESGEADLGIEILERMRNRSVLAGLAGAAQGVTGPELAEVRARIAELQRRLLRDDAAGLRAEVIGRLEQLEQQEEALLVRLGAVTLESPAPPTLVRLQAALSPETALLSFQVPVWSDAESRFDGAWLLCIDRVAIRVFALPDPADLRRAVDAFDGLLGRNDRAARHAASRLYGELLAPALAELAPSVRRLVLIPDGPLHRLAFAALSAGELEPPLGASFELERASSFAAWLATVDPALPPRTAAALVLADPEVTEVDGPAARRSLVKLDATTLGRLAGARREAAAVARLFGESAHVLLGTGASEHALKSVDLSRVGLVHIAAHALVDDQRPYRSAILLAPGGGEDGLLQMRDIVGLRLDGAIVVLASCRSGDGARFAGEGIFSLARAFLDAGASAVVANLEAVDDLESSALLEPLFRGLRRGLPVRSALAEARRSGFEAAKSTAWATTVLLGDGDARLVPAAAGGSWPRIGIWALAVALLLAVGVLSTKLRPRSRRR